MKNSNEQASEWKEGKDIKKMKNELIFEKSEKEFKRTHSRECKEEESKKLFANADY